MSNPQFPYAGTRTLMRNPEPTELMPLKGYKTQGRIAGILQTQQFKPFSFMGIQREFSQQTMFYTGSGIQQGQVYNQPLTTLNSQF